MSELASDRGLHDCNILPEGVFLPKVTAAEYCKVGPDALAFVLLKSSHLLPLPHCSDPT